MDQIFTLGEHSYSTGTDGTKSKLDYANAVKLLNEASGEYAKGNIWRHCKAFRN